jgi:hypothetical protein
MTSTEHSPYRVFIIFHQWSHHLPTMATPEKPIIRPIPVWNYAWNSFGVSGVVSMCLYAEPN